MKLNLGCGSNRMDGWENHDADVDITKPLPWPDNSVEFILAEHVVEHVSGPDALRFFDECYRVLQKGGVLRICVPILQNVSLEKRRDLILGHGHLMVFSHTSLAFMLTAAGFASYDIRESTFKECDGHWKVIGREQDAAETLRMEATK